MRAEPDSDVLGAEDNLFFGQRFVVLHECASSASGDPSLAALAIAYQMPQMMARIWRLG
jgi:hypothetical protein